MIENVIVHGHSFIWDMEIDEYKDTYLHEFYDDTIIDFEYIYCDEAYVSYRGLKRYGDSKWEITIPIMTDNNADVFEHALKELSQKKSFILDFRIAREKYVSSTIRILIDKDMSIYEAYYYTKEISDIITDYVLSIEYKHLSEITKKDISAMLPVYFRATKKVELEISNFATDDSKNARKIIDICSRVKTIESIEEKVYRKKICQLDLLDSFDDIAGVRCTCEFLSDVYDVLEYIKVNPLLKVQSIEDKIENPSDAGYRGIHVIANTDVYYHGKLYNGIKVEIQLRTAFQNAWSMKTHQLTYKQDLISDDISNTMRMMSNALNEADRAAQNIKDQLRGV